MPTFDNNESGSSVRSKINSAISTVDSLNSGDNLLMTTAERNKLTNVADNATQNTTEQIQDLVGAMISGNTETRITATYQDVDGTIDFVVDGDLANYTNTPGYITGYTVTEGDVTAHEAALSITESQINDLGTYQVQLSEGPFVNGDKNKLNNIEAGANVTDATNVAAAGAVMSAPAGITGADQITNMVSLTQAEYDAITPNASTFYVITG